MKTIILDSGLGGKDFMKKMKEEIKMNTQFVKLFHKMLSEYDKDYIRRNLLKILQDYSKKKIPTIIIACHTASSCILDLLIKHDFMIYNIQIFEPIMPMCQYIKEKKYKKIVILSTPLTQKIGWHKRLLHSKDVVVKYITFLTLAKEIEDHRKDQISKSLNRLNKQKDFLKICDCVVLGCTHYNIMKDQISEELKIKYDFHGVVLDSNEVLLQYYKDCDIK